MVSPCPPVDFLSLLPLIRHIARNQFSRLGYESRQEAIAETVARAFVFYRRLVERGLTDRIAATPLAEYAARQVRAGRCVGTSMNSHDVSSRLCQNQRQISLERLDRYNEQDEEWEEILVEDRHTTPAEIATTRIDFRAWLQQLPDRLRRVAELLATGESTSEASRRFGLSSGRISQIRTELHKAWLAFQSEVPACEAA